MSDVSPGPDWWQATDGRWYPPELRPTTRLVRHSSGATILVPTDEGGDRDPPGDSGNVAPPSHEDVGGSIHSHASLYLGRPAGLQNRPAAWLALVGAIVMLAGSLLPWATRSIAAGGDASLGFRDAAGNVGGGFYAVLLAVTVMTVSVRCMAGSYSRGWRAALVALAAGSIGLAAVEAVRIQQAISKVTDLTRGNATLTFGPGLVVLVAGALVVLVAAGAYRVGSPD
jgi:hypothetical protein